MPGCPRRPQRTPLDRTVAADRLGRGDGRPTCRESNVRTHAAASGRAELTHAGHQVTSRSGVAPLDAPTGGWAGRRGGRRTVSRCHLRLVSMRGSSRWSVSSRRASSQDDHDLFGALGALRGQGAGLRNEGRLVKAGCTTKYGDDGQAAGADHRVADMDDGVAAGVERGDRGPELGERRQGRTARDAGWRSYPTRSGTIPKPQSRPDGGALQAPDRPSRTFRAALTCASMLNGSGASAGRSASAHSSGDEDRAAKTWTETIDQ